MCGIVGAYDLGAGPAGESVVRRMTHAIRHRGPDGEGYAALGACELGHRRLSIIDLSDAGAQPMANETGDVLVVHNGEIYNFRELRDELVRCGHVFRTQTDTEVIVHGYEEWGDRCVDRFNGMFASAVLDRRRGGPGRLMVARDRYGIKPLYYALRDGELLFASEIKALLQHPRVSVRVCYPALSEYFTFQNVFTDRTLFDGIHLLPPGTQLVVDGGDRPVVRQQQYWDFDFRSDGVPPTFGEAAERLSHLFERAVQRQLVADVPVGAYLSGGMDSGSITAVAARCIPRITTFTGGFDLSSASGLELGFDERRASEMLANRFKTEHYEIVLHAGDMEHVLPALIWHLEDLRVGQSYPNYYVARLASRFVRVVLSGAGGDELFAGYPWRYFRGLNGASGGYQDAYYDYWQRLVPDQDRPSFFNAETQAKVVHHPPREVFRAVFGAHAPSSADLEQVINASLYFESKTFLHGLFIVEDKLSMAHSLETRVPFMDNDIVDFALRVPPRFKLRDLARAPLVDEDEAGKRTKYGAQATADGKIILREAMKRLVPEDVTSRAKQGFAAPDASWFRGESIDYVNALLRDRAARINDFFEPGYVGRVLQEHSAGQVNHRLLIWSLLSFEWWLRTFIP